MLLVVRSHPHITYAKKHFQSTPPNTPYILSFWFNWQNVLLLIMYFCVCVTNTSAGIWFTSISCRCPRFWLCLPRECFSLSLLKWLWYNVRPDLVTIQWNWGDCHFSFRLMPIFWYQRVGSQIAVVCIPVLEARIFWRSNSFSYWVLPWMCPACCSLDNSNPLGVLRRILN